jgi:hypothetical protein
MHLLFIHQNFPAQFRCLAPRLARDYGWTCTFATSNDRIPAAPGVDKVIYRPRRSSSPAEHPAVRRFSTAIGHAQGVYEVLKARTDVRPDRAGRGSCAAAGP